MRAISLIPIKKTIFVCFLMHIFSLFVEKKLLTTFEELKGFVDVCVKFVHKELRTSAALVKAWKSFACDDTKRSQEFANEVNVVVFNLQMAVHNAAKVAGTSLTIAEVIQAAMEANVSLSSTDEDSRHSVISEITEDESDTMKEKSEESCESKSDVAMSETSEGESQISKSEVSGKKPDDLPSAEDQETENSGSGNPFLESMLKAPVKEKSVTTPTWESYVTLHETQSRERKAKTKTETETKIETETKTETKIQIETEENYWDTLIDRIIRTEIVKPVEQSPSSSRTSSRRSRKMTSGKRGKSPVSTRYQYVKKSEKSSVDVDQSAQGIKHSAQISKESGSIKSSDVDMEIATGKEQSTELKSSDDGSAVKGIKQTDGASGNVPTITQKRAISEDAAKETAIDDLTGDMEQDSEEECPASPVKKGRLSKITTFKSDESDILDPSTEKSDSVVMESPERGNLAETTTESSPEKSMED